MSLNVSLHSPIALRVQHFDSCGERAACITFVCENDDEIDIYLDPSRADRLVEAFMPPLEQAEEDPA